MSDRPVTLAELAIMAGRSYDWASRYWRQLPVARLDAPGRPRFVRASVEAWLRGEPHPSTVVHLAQPAPDRHAVANDATPHKPAGEEARLLRAFGG